jgi:hypothetical protein
MWGGRYTAGLNARCFLPVGPLAAPPALLSRRNNNAGGVAPRGALGGGGGGNHSESRLGAIVEDDEDEYDSEHDSDDSGYGATSSAPANAEHVPQCFSHFTYDNTKGRKLVCDLQVCTARRTSYQVRPDGRSRRREEGVFAALALPLSPPAASLRPRALPSPNPHPFPRTAPSSNPLALNRP